MLIANALSHYPTGLNSQPSGGEWIEGACQVKEIPVRRQDLVVPCGTLTLRLRRRQQNKESKSICVETRIATKKDDL